MECDHERQGRARRRRADQRGPGRDKALIPGQRLATGCGGGRARRAGRAESHGGRHGERRAEEHGCHAVRPASARSLDLSLPVAHRPPLGGQDNPPKRGHWKRPRPAPLRSEARGPVPPQRGHNGGAAPGDELVGPDAKGGRQARTASPRVARGSDAPGQTVLRRRRTAPADPAAPAPCATGRTARRTRFPSGNQRRAARYRRGSHPRCDSGGTPRGGLEPGPCRHATLWAPPPTVDRSRRTRVGFHLPRTGIATCRYG